MVPLALNWAVLSSDQFEEVVLYCRNHSGLSSQGLDPTFGQTPTFGQQQAFVQNFMNSHVEAILIRSTNPSNGIYLKHNLPTELPAPIMTLVMALNYRYTVEGPIDRNTQVKRTLVMSESDETIFNYAKHFGVFRSYTEPNLNLSRTYLNYRTFDPNQRESIRNQVILIMSALGYLTEPIPSGVRAKVWSYSFPNNYCPEDEPILLAKFKTEQLSIQQEIEYTLRMSDHILKELRSTQMGHLIQDQQTQRKYLIDRNPKTGKLGLIRTITPEIIPEITWGEFPTVPLDYWDYLICPQLNLSLFQKEILSHLRGPIIRSDNQYEWRSYLVHSNEHYHLAIVTTDPSKEWIQRFMTTHTYRPMRYRPDYYYELF